MDWKEAEKHLKETRLAYTEIGVAGLIGLQFVINPILIRFENRERTQELYDDIMGLK